MLIDTDVLIWVSRGNDKAIEVLDNIESIVISDVTYMELIQGAFNKQFKAIEGLAIHKLKI